MKRVQRPFTWLVLVSVAWASLIDCPFALDLIEDGFEFESAGPPHFAQARPPEQNDPLASRLAYRILLATLQKMPATVEPAQHVCVALATVVASVLDVLTDSSRPRSPPGA